MEQSRPFVSIVVPTYNRVELLRDSLKSLLAQDYPCDRYEIIVVDDGSEDGTGRLVTSLREEDGRVLWCRQQRGGINRARNKGIAEARGEVVGIIDDDEIAPAGLVSKAVRLLMDSPWAAALGGWVRPTQEPRAGFMCRKCSEVFKGIRYRGGNDQAVEVTDVPGGCLFAWRRTFRVYGSFDEALSGWGDDAEWCARVRRHGARFVMGRDVWVWHRVRLGNLRLRELWNQFGPIWHYVEVRKVMGWNGSALRDFALGMRSLAHGLRRGCPFGLVHGAWRMALAWRWMNLRSRPHAKLGTATATNEGEQWKVNSNR